MLISARATAVLLFSCLTLSACSTTPPCEDILEVKRQEQNCIALAKIMKNNQYPQQAITARKRYQEECENLRYYRDDFDTICKGHQQPIGAKRKE